MKLRLRFGLRTIFALIAICAAILAWHHSTLRWISDRDEAMEWMLGPNHTLHRFGHGVHDAPYENYWEADLQVRAPWTLRLFGESGWRAIGCPEALLERGRELFPEALFALPYPER